MNILEIRDEYRAAQKLGQKECKDLRLRGKSPHPAVLDEILGDAFHENTEDVGLVNIPTDRIVGTKSAGRITAFSAGFYPLLDVHSEFGHKWVTLCAAHLSEQGIQDPIVCFEYLGKFYIQEGNKRVSVLKYFGAPRIPALVRRILPPMSDDPKIKAYYEFRDFFKVTGMYDIQFRRPGDYSKLLSYLGKDPGESWTEREQMTFRAYFQYFREAYSTVQDEHLDLLPEEALLLWLKVYPYHELGQRTSEELRKSVAALWEDMLSISQDEPIQMETEDNPEVKSSLFDILLPSAPSHLRVAFVYQMNPETSTWAKAHEDGAQYMYKKFPEKVSIYHYYNADTQEQAEALIEQAVLEGAHVVFTTTPKLSRATLKMAVKYPKIRFLNCSVNAPYSSVRTYYCRIFEAKFITGAIAGAMANNDRIGYVGAYPIFGLPASVNAFALGAQLTNPRARIDLRWSCMPGNPVEDLIQSGVDVISNRDIPTPDNKYLEYGEYGTYLVENGILQPLGSACWLWGKFYEKVIRSILNGKWNKIPSPNKAINYWWGMDSGVIDVKLAQNIPEGMVKLTEILRKGLKDGSIDPFRRHIVAQDGTVINEGDRILSVDELLHMDWLCENVEGFIPSFDQILPFAKDTVRELGVYRDKIPMEKEGNL